MKTMKAKDLKKILIEASRLTKGMENTIPICTYALVGNGAIIVSDLQTEITYYAPFGGNQYCCPILDLKRFVTNLKPSDEVGLMHQEDAIHVSVNGTELYKLAADMPPLDFPRSSATRHIKPIGGFLAEDVETIKTLAKFRSSDELRPAMTGLYVDGKEMVATDGAVLGRMELMGTLKKKKGKGIIFPGSIFGYLANEMYEITSAGKNYVELSGGSRAIVFRMIDETYPQFENVWPIDNPVKVGVDREGFVRELKMALAASNKTTHQVRLLINDGAIKVHSEDLDFASEYNGSIKATIAGEQTLRKDEERDPEKPVMEIGFNAKLLIDVVSAKKEQLTIIEMSAPARAAIIDSNLLVMPVMLNNYV